MGNNFYNNGYRQQNNYGQQNNRSNKAGGNQQTNIVYNNYHFPVGYYDPYGNYEALYFGYYDQYGNWIDTSAESLQFNQYGEQFPACANFKIKKEHKPISKKAIIIICSVLVAIIAAFVVIKVLQNKNRGIEAIESVASKTTFTASELEQFEFAVDNKSGKDISKHTHWELNEKEIATGENKCTLKTTDCIWGQNVLVAYSDDTADRISYTFDLLKDTKSADNYHKGLSMLNNYGEYAITEQVDDIDESSPLLSAFVSDGVATYTQTVDCGKITVVGGKPYGIKIGKAIGVPGALAQYSAITVIGDFTDIGSATLHLDLNGKDSEYYTVYKFLNGKLTTIGNSKCRFSDGMVSFNINQSATYLLIPTYDDFVTDINYNIAFIKVGQGDNIKFKPGTILADTEDTTIGSNNSDKMVESSELAGENLVDGADESADTDESTEEEAVEAVEEVEEDSKVVKDSKAAETEDTENSELGETADTEVEQPMYLDKPKVTPAKAELTMNTDNYSGILSSLVSGADELTKKPIIVNYMTWENGYCKLSEDESESNRNYTKSSIENALTALCKSNESNYLIKTVVAFDMTQASKEQSSEIVELVNGYYENKDVNYEFIFINAGDNFWDNFSDKLSSRFRVLCLSSDESFNVLKNYVSSINNDFAVSSDAMYTLESEEVAVEVVATCNPSYSYSLCSLIPNYDSGADTTYGFGSVLASKLAVEGKLTPELFDGCSYICNESKNMKAKAISTTGIDFSSDEVKLLEGAAINNLSDEKLNDVCRCMSVQACNSSGFNDINTFAEADDFNRVMYSVSESLRAGKPVVAAIGNSIGLQEVLITDILQTKADKNVYYLGFFNPAHPGDRCFMKLEYSTCSKGGSLAIKSNVSYTDKVAGISFDKLYISKNIKVVHNDDIIYTDNVLE